MPLLARDAVRARLRCPVCSAALDDGYRCTSAACASAGAPYRVVAGQPVLIDAGDSIVDPAEVVPATPHARGSLRALVDRIGPRNPVAPRLAARLAADLRTDGEAATVLVVGGGTVGSGLDVLYETPGIDVVAFDVFPSKFTQFVADGHRIPLADASVDAVVVQAVLEHVLDPWRVVAEIRRVLRDGGRVFADTPFLQPVHEGAYDFTRFTESGHRWLFRDFTVIESGMVAGPGTQMVSSLAHAARSVIPLKGVATAVRLAATFAGVAVDRIARARPEALDGASSVYFYGRKDGTTLTPRAMIAHYRGAQRPIDRRG